MVADDKHEQEVRSTRAELLKIIEAGDAIALCDKLAAVGGLQRGVTVDEVLASRGGNGSTLLMAACRGRRPTVSQKRDVESAHVSMVEVLLEHGADPNLQDAHRKDTALHYAYESHWIEVAHLLERGGANKKQKNALGVTPRRVRRSTKHRGKKRRESKAKAAATASMKSKRLQLGCLVRDDDADGIASLLSTENKALVDLPNHSGLTPLMVSAQLGKLQALNALIDAGASVGPVDPHRGNTALHYAYESGVAKAVQALLDAGANKEAHNAFGLTPVAMTPLAEEEAAPQPYAVLVRKEDPVLRASRKLASQAASGNDAAAAAAVKELLDPNTSPFAAQGVDIATLVRRFGGKTLVAAARHGRLAVLKVLIAAGADLNYADMRRGDTALHVASEQRHKSCVAELLKLGADDGVRNRVGVAARELVAIMENADAGADADTDAEDERALATLLRAVRLGTLSELEKTLVSLPEDEVRSAAIVNSHDRSGFTPLLCAVERGAGVAPTKALLAAKADVNVAEMHRDNTPLMVARQYGRAAIAELLLVAGADASAKNGLGLSAGDIQRAMEAHHSGQSERSAGEYAGRASSRVESFSKEVIRLIKRGRSKPAELSELIERVRAAEHALSSATAAAAAGPQQPASAPAAEGAAGAEAEAPEPELEKAALAIQCQVRSQQARAKVQRKRSGDTRALLAAVLAARDHLGLDALMHACARRRLDLVRVLVEEGGADVNAQDTRRQDTPLHLAAEREDSDLMMYLVSKGAGADAQNAMGATPGSIAKAHQARRERAAKAEHAKDAQRDAEAGALLAREAAHLLKGDADDAEEKTLGVLKQAGFVEGDAASPLAAEGAPEDDKDGASSWALMRGGLLQYRDHLGLTLLMNAAEQGQLGVVKALVEAGADINAQDEHRGCTAVHLAIECNHGHGRVPQHARYGAVCMYLASKGADMELQNKSGLTPSDLLKTLGHHRTHRKTKAAREADAKYLHYLYDQMLHACRRDDAAAVRTLLDEWLGHCHHSNLDADGRSLDVADLLDHRDSSHSGSTPLMTAAAYANAETARVLIAWRVDVNAQNDEGNTALHFARMRGSEASRISNISRFIPPHTHHRRPCTNALFLLTTTSTTRATFGRRSPNCYYATVQYTLSA